MKKYIVIGLGGALGAILRYVIKNINIPQYREVIPINTLAINLSGAFILALILTTACGVAHFNENIKLGIATGFLGAYTTFSTMCKETAVLINKGFYFSAVSYIGISAIFGLFFAYFGDTIAKEKICTLVNDDDKEEEAS
ncbi:MULTISPECIES: fluoride efflux transporter CrcB [Clostridium]|uniref:fluoride efflux transporter CrcB n=1 Tax=Clostridium TaxID=1485 RepID=UPI000825A986|nr:MULTISPECIES: fluoride efflux transporter CrcB [Clostridium]PJI06761.1 fluoride efflux transporter CrcB [Clostridium sp. CT7]